jgi:hypothetical protein
MRGSKPSALPEKPDILTVAQYLQSKEIVDACFKKSDEEMTVDNVQHIRRAATEIEYIRNRRLFLPRALVTPQTNNQQQIG